MKRKQLPFLPIFVFQSAAVFVEAVVEAVVAVVAVVFCLSDSRLHQPSSCSLLVVVALKQK